MPENQTKSTMTELLDNFLVRHTWVPGSVPGMRLHRQSNLVLADSGLALPSWNVVLRPRFEASQSQRWVDFVTGWFAQGSANFTWWLDGSEPTELRAVLDAAGMGPPRRRQALTAPLGPPLPPLDPPPLWLEVRPVNSERELEAFAAVQVATQFPPEPDYLQFIERAAERILQPSSPLHFLVGYLDGVPVAVAELVVTPTGAGLYTLAVLQAHRGKGLGAAMLRHSMNQAAELGAGRFFALAMPGHEGGFLRAGLKPLACWSERIGS